MKKRISVVLAICMLVTMIPTMSFATETADAHDKHAPVKKVREADLKRMTSAEAKQPEQGSKSNSASVIKAKEAYNNVELGARKGTAVAELNGVYYESLQDAIDDAGTGDEIVLVNDVIDEGVNIYEKNITIDMKDCAIISKNDVDLVWIENSDVYMHSGRLINMTEANLEESNTCIYTESSTVLFEDLWANTMYADDAMGFWIGPGSYASLYECEYYNGSEVGDDCDYEITGFNVSVDAFAEFDRCSSSIDNGWVAYVWGEAEFDKCYFTGEMIGTTAIGVDDAGYATIKSGYYYAESPLCIWEDAEAKITEGQFDAMYESASAIWSEYGGYGGMVDIPSGYTYVPTNWKTTEADQIFIYKNLAAPTSVVSNLTAANGTTAGYDDIKTTWSKVSGVDGYRVTYKKGSGSYTGSKYFSPTATRSRTIANLTDGAKYTFKVVSCVAVNEDILEKGTLCPCSKYKTDYVYTLKKVTLGTFKKSNGKVKVAWKNISGETGYQISKSTKKTGTNIVYTYKTTSGTSKLISATKGKTYYYKVRAYKTVGDKKVYGPWSAVKSYKRK